MVRYYADESRRLESLSEMHDYTKANQLKALWERIRGRLDLSQITAKTKEIVLKNFVEPKKYEINNLVSVFAHAANVIEVTATFLDKPCCANLAIEIVTASTSAKPDKKLVI